MNEFSVALGLLDYVNPILYALIFTNLIKNLRNKINKKFFIPFCVGSILSLSFGLLIPTVKVIVGLKIMEFSMPVNLVFFVNVGFFISGLSLFISTFKDDYYKNSMLSIILPYSLFNSIAVFLGVIGIVLLYISLIRIAKVKDRKKTIIFICISICLTLFLGCVGSFADVTNAIVHWVIEITNICCQFCFYLGTLALFSKNKA